MDEPVQQGKDYKYIPMISVLSRTGEEVTTDVYYYTDQIVNICMLGTPKDGKWILVDTGLPFSATEIIKTAENRDYEQ